MNYSNDVINLLRLARTENVGAVLFSQLLRKYQTADKALDALPTIARRGGRKAPYKLISTETVIKELDDLYNAGGKAIFLTDDNYPKRLKSIYDPPPVLSCFGHTHLLNNPQIAIVGARNASTQAKNLAHRFAEVLGGDHKLIITSGLAKGIDAAVHQGALATGTVAVVAGGVDYIYPKENNNLYEQIKEMGCIISEAPFSATPQARHFPKRNRIISGLSLGVLVIEAAIKSGSLITARQALEQGRDVFAVPGSPLDARARGCNKLIRDGATLTETPDDIMPFIQMTSGRDLFEHEYDESDYRANNVIDDEISDDLCENIYQLLSSAPIDIDMIIRDSDASTASVLGALMALELAGRIQREAGGKIVAIKPVDNF